MFLDKNRDLVRPELFDLLIASQSQVGIKPKKYV